MRIHCNFLKVWQTADLCDGDEAGLLFSFLRNRDFFTGLMCQTAQPNDAIGYPTLLF